MEHENKVLSPKGMIYCLCNIGLSMTTPRPPVNTDIRASKQIPFCVSEQQSVTCAEMAEHNMECRQARNATISL
jgi:hypothetical protein